MPAADQEPAHQTRALTTQLAAGNTTPSEGAAPIGVPRTSLNRTAAPPTAGEYHLSKLTMPPGRSPMGIVRYFGAIRVPGIGRLI